MVKVSFVISAYNSEVFLANSLQSCLSQTYNNFDIILVNDGSKDSTDSICKKYSKQYPNKIKYYHKMNSGLTESLIYGIKQSNAKWIARIDADDFSSSDRLYAQLCLAKQTKSYLIGSNCFTVSDNSIKKIKYSSDSKRLYLNLVHFRKFFPHSSAFFSKELYDFVKGYSVFYEKSQDKDLWLKMAKYSSIACSQKFLTTLNLHSNQISKESGGLYQHLYSIIAVSDYLFNRKYGISYIAKVQKSFNYPELYGESLKLLDKEYNYKNLFTTNSNKSITQYLPATSKRYSLLAYSYSMAYFLYSKWVKSYNS